MLILVGVVVSTIINSDLINDAKEAKKMHETKQGEEANLSGVTIGGETYGSLQDYVSMIHRGYSSGGEKSPFIGCYADVNDDEIVDGIIYADIEFDASSQDGEANGVNLPSEKDTLNDYYISQEKYKYKSFNEKPVISPTVVEKDETNDRFYVMALEDFTTEAYTDEENPSNSYPAYIMFYFYDKAYDSNRNPEGLMDPLVTTDGFSSEECIGRKNTKAMIEIWDKNGEEGGYVGATQSNKDIWKHIKNEVANGWFVPSRAEWGEFIKLAADQGVNSNNSFEDFGLSDYWTSTQLNSEKAYWVAPRSMRTDYSILVSDYSLPVRLSTTF